MSEPSENELGKSPPSLAPGRLAKRSGQSGSDSILACAPAAPGAAATGDKPPQQRPELPEFWDQRFRNGATPWEADGVPAQLRAFAAELGAAPRTLIPGCGSAREAAHLDALGWPVTALDFAGEAIAAARQVLAAPGVAFRGELLHADFFAFAAAPFELVYERAFLCALPRKRWPAYAPRLAELLLPGGLLAGYFYFGETLKGPPFAIRPEELDAMLSADFERIADAPASDSVGVFAGGERWQVWRRR